MPSLLHNTYNDCCMSSGRADGYVYCGDLSLGELATAIKNRTDIHYGLYFSHFEWFHPLYLKDKGAKFQTQEYIKVSACCNLFLTCIS